MSLWDLPIFSQSLVVVHEGHYDGKNIYVQNPFSGDGQGFCVSKVKINDIFISDQITSSAFEIDLSRLNLKIGDPIVLQIYHKTDCLPKILGPEMIKRKCTFQTVDITIEEDSLKWETVNEQGKMTFLVEQYRWNKWVKIGEVYGIGINMKNKYSFPVKPISGENKFRVKQIDYSGKPCISPVAITNSLKSEIQLRVDVENSQFHFSEATFYEIFDIHENMVKKGFSDQVDISNLEKGIYWVNYDAICGKEVNLNNRKIKKHGKHNIRR